MKHVSKNHWFLYNLIAVLMVLALFTPLPSAAAQTTLPACEITGVIFDQDQYNLGDNINITVRLANSQGTPLGGAVVRADVTKEGVQAATATGFGLIDRIGEYDGTYTLTDVAGQYIFNFTASDPTEASFSPCSATEAVLVGKIVQPNPTDGNPGSPTPTTNPVTPTPTSPVTVTPTITPTTIDPVTPTPTSPITVTPTVTPTTPVTTPTPVTVTPTITPTTSTPTPTPTSTQPGTTKLGPNPVDLTIDSCTTTNSMAINLQSGTSDSIVGVELELQYDPKIAQVVDADTSTAKIDVQVGSGFPTSGSFIVQNEVDTTNGKIFFAATILGGKLSQNAELIVIKWRAVGSGTSPVTFNKVNLANADAQAVNATVISGTVKSSVTCASTVSGQAILEGRTDNSGVTVIGSTGEQMQTASDGRFTVKGGEPVMVSRKGYLRARVEVGTAAQVAGGDLTATDVGQITLKAGDINSDGLINILDLAYIAQKYQGQDNLADLTGDGKVNIFDLSLAAKNYGEKEAFGLEGPKQLPASVK